VQWCASYISITGGVRIAVPLEALETMAAPAGSIWAAIIGVIAILVSIGTLYRLRAQAIDHSDSEVRDYFE
jgi:hypothetical protein